MTGATGPRVAEAGPSAPPVQRGRAALEDFASAADGALVHLAPDLRPGFRASLPKAGAAVAARLVAALHRERLASVDPLGTGRRSGFDRVEVDRVGGGACATDPGRLALDLLGPRAAAVAVELADASVNLAVAYARRARSDVALRAQATALGAGDCFDLVAPLDPDAQCAFFERLTTEGHNLHPCGRTRLGWDVPDLLAHDVESPSTSVGLVGVRRDLHLGHEVGALLADAYPQLAHRLDPARYAVVPVHAWQERFVVRGRYADLVADRVLVPVDGARLPAVPTAALRTVLLPPGADGSRRYLKLSLDIQVTSTRRTISVASTQNGPVLSDLLGRLLADDPAGARVLLFTETAGAAVRAPGDRSRDLAAIVRSGLSGRLGPDEVAVPGIGLYGTSPLTGRTVLAELVDRFAATRGLTDRATAGLRFLREYAELLLPPALRLATRHGIALEAHLQNCVPTFVAGVPHRLAVRDFAGLRIHQGRLTASRGRPVSLWPGSVVVTEDLDVLRAKLGYTALQAHLSEVVLRLMDSHGVAEGAAWSVVRAVIDSEYDAMRADPVTADAARADHAFLTAATMPHKALLRMRLTPAAGDIYLPVRNPLHRPGR
jgi:siderophore synthetase component